MYGQRTYRPYLDNLVMNENKQRKSGLFSSSLAVFGAKVVWNLTQIFSEDIITKLYQRDHRDEIRKQEEDLDRKLEFLEVLPLKKTLYW